MTFSSEINLTSNIFLYDEPRTENLRLDEIGRYVEAKTGLDVELRDDFLLYYPSDDLDTLAKRLAASKVRNPEKRDEQEPMYGEINIEKRLLNEPNLKLPGIFYDGLKLYRILQSMIPERERTLESLHIIFTNRLFGTFDERDGRYHARVILCGYPSIISTSGIVEAPAKPRGFYAAKQKLGSMGIEAMDVIKVQYKGQFIDYDDERMTEVMKGYVMQALFYHLVNEPFCDNRKCRLFNAHWQSEVLEAQLESGGYCERHERILEKVRHEDRPR